MNRLGIFLFVLREVCKYVCCGAGVIGGFFFVFLFCSLIWLLGVPQDQQVVAIGIWLDGDMRVVAVILRNTDEKQGEANRQISNRKSTKETEVSS